ncbi:putative pumilio domain-containing protein [Erysiphe necator]|uniref:Putative pumilio domain-containing protein n=1 Tax=Uncinula necator TaxID=52586 RepID=A0A0B1P670_UNCNE|nr:putative pumilio domain-containing protein [Erysiphe necator]
MMSTVTVSNSGSSGVKRKSASISHKNTKKSKLAKPDKVKDSENEEKSEKSRSKSNSEKKSKVKSALVKKLYNSKIQKVQKIQKVSEFDSSVETSLGVEKKKTEENFDKNSSLETKNQDGLHPERVKAILQNGQSSREAHAKQKQIAQERKAAKPLADDLVRTKKIWERLRRKSHVPREERKQLVKELFDILTGRVKDFVLKHDSVRVVQTAIKYANPEQKRIIAKELAGSYRQLAESKYAKFLIGKLLVQGDDEIRDIIIPEFFGHVRRLIKHPEASWILDDIYRGAATKSQKAQILRECYGVEFALFQDKELNDVTSVLSEILSHDPGKRETIMNSLMELINQLIQKKMTGFTLLHDAMLQYFLNTKIGTNEATDFLGLLKGEEEDDLLKNLAFTKSGSRLVCLALAHENAKGRKLIMRAFKDTLQMMASDDYGHVIILVAYEVIDDTVFTSKSIFPEILSKDADKQVENAVLSANNLNARTTLLYLFEGRSKALFPISLSSDIKILEEIEDARKLTSKKDSKIRRAELAKELSPYLLKVIEVAASRLIQTSFGCQFVTTVLLEAQGDKSAALHAVAKTAAGNPTSTYLDKIINAPDGSTCDDTSSLTHISSSSYGGKMLRSLLAGGRFNHETKSIMPVVPALDFSNILYPYIRENILQWAIGPASFVILALVESESFSKKQEVLELLKSEKTLLEKASEELRTDEVIQNKILDTVVATSSESKCKNLAKKKSQTGKKSQAGNRGSKLLLNMLKTL